MKYYPHHIGDFDRATRHLSRIERSIYRDLIELYYDTEKPLSLDIQSLCRRIIARTNEEVTAVEQALNEFFIETPDGWFHSRCDTEIDKFLSSNTQKSQAGKASAAKRALKKQQALNARSTDVQQTCNGTPTILEPATKNHKPYKYLPDDLSIAGLISEKVLLITKSTKPPNLESWANSIRMMREIDNRPPELIRSVFLWANQDGFWKSNILSAPTLRDKFDKLFAKMNSEAANGPYQQSNQQRPDNSVAGEIRRNVAREIAATRASAEAVAADGVTIWPQMGEQLREGSGSGQSVGCVLEGDYARAD